MGEIAQRFQRRTDEVEAVQFLPGDGVASGEMFTAHGVTWPIQFTGASPHVRVGTREGPVDAGYGDWVVLHADGALSVASADDFAASLAPVDQPTGYSFHAPGGDGVIAHAPGATSQPREHGPTIEAFVAAGYRAVDYPPAGYDEKPSPGLDAFRTWQQDTGSAEKHAAAAAALGVSAGEVTHGKIAGPGELDLARERAAQDARVRAEAEAASTRSPEAGAEETARIAAEHGIDRATVGEVPTRTPQSGDPAFVPSPDSGVSLSDLPVIDAATGAALTERRVNDPGSLTEAEAAQLARFEHLGGVGEQRVNDPASLTDDERKALAQTERLARGDDAAKAKQFAEDLGLPHEPTDAELEDLTRPDDGRNPGGNLNSDADNKPRRRGRSFGGA